MITNVRDILGGIELQGSDEEVNHPLTIPTTWGIPLTVTEVKVYSYNETTGVYTDVTATIMPVIPALPSTSMISGQIIAVPELKAMTIGVLYRVQVKFTTSADVLSVFKWVRCER